MGGVGGVGGGGGGVDGGGEGGEGGEEPRPSAPRARVRLGRVDASAVGARPLQHGRDGAHRGRDTSC